MSKHTPGPLRVWGASSISPSVRVVNPNGHDVAFFPTGYDATAKREISKDEAAANAELFAAAPDLLAACEAAYEAVMREDFGTLTLAPKLRAAIAKAEGGQP